MLLGKGKENCSRYGVWNQRISGGERHSKGKEEELVQLLPILLGGKGRAL